MYGFLAIHPGEHLKDEMEARGLTVSKTANLITAQSGAQARPTGFYTKPQNEGQQPSFE